jgi:hypothetical protein
MGCYNSAIVHAPAERVWRTVGNFLDMSWAPEVVESCQPIGDSGGTQIGAQRVLNGVFHETLVGLDERARILRYSIDDGPDAVSKENVSGYIGEVRVQPITEDDSSFVTWGSSWEASGGGVAEFCNPIYQALLGQLKKHFA